MKVQMANYSLIRGWIECSFDDVESIHRLVCEHWSTSGNYRIPVESAELYKLGWTFPKLAINWTSVIFFGADVKEASLDFISDCLSKIADSRLEVEGYFHVDHEAGENPRLWIIEGGRLLDVAR